jgi:hypothetical protein
MPDPAVMEQVHELQLLRHEYQAEMSVCCEQAKKSRLYRMVQELNVCIEHLQQNTSH